MKIIIVNKKILAGGKKRMKRVRFSILQYRNLKLFKLIKNLSLTTYRLPLITCLIVTIFSISLYGATITVSGISNWGGYKDLSGNDVIVTATGEISVVSSLTLVCDNLTIQSNGKINADSKGWPSSEGPGQGGDSGGGGRAGGAGHGGKGGDGYLGGAGGNPYDSSIQPVEMGSGGGKVDTYAGGAGGGAIRLIISGTLLLDGTITANGGDGSGSSSSHAGGGSGGSIWVNCYSLSGKGSFHANGGKGHNGTDSYDGGGGAGGRIAVYYSNSSFADMANSSVNGGWGAEYGERGTCAFFDQQQNNMYIVDGWRFQPGEDPFANGYQFGSIKMIDADNNVTTLCDINLSISNQFILTNTDWDLGSYNLNLQTKNITIYSGSSLTANDMQLSCDGQIFLDRDVSISANTGKISLKTPTLDLEDVSITIPYLNIKVTNTMNIFKNSFIRGVSGGTIEIHLANDLDIINSVIKSGTNIFNSAATITFSGTSNIGNIFITSSNLSQTVGSIFDSSGYGLSTGEGVGSVVQSGVGQGGGGAGYGGTGEAGTGPFAGGNWYGSAIHPTNLGSGGGEAFGGIAGGAGGGIIRINLSGNYDCNEVVKANGGNGAVSGDYGAGGGSGGSIYVNCGSLSGNGYFIANGGDGGDGAAYDGGGGAGGRIAIYFGSSSFSGEANCRVDGGNGNSAEPGKKGTLAFFDNTDKSINIYQGWQWLSGEDPFMNNYNFKDLSINNAGNIYTELTNANLKASDNLSITASTMVNPAADLLLEGANITLFGATISGRNITISPSVSLADFIQCNIFTSNNLNIEIPNSLNINNTRFDSENLKLQTEDDLNLINFSEISGNIDFTAPNLYIEFGSKISADGKGYYAYQGPGKGASGGANQGGGGAGYGGTGGQGYGPVPAGNVYGSSNMPVDKGSGGGNSGALSGGKGGRGGGAIKLNITGTFTLEGTITANGDDGDTNNSCGGGAGSGGSIYVYADTLTSPTFGFGAFHADGGKGGNSTYWGGGAGGGRIAVYCYNLDSSFNTNLSTVKPGTNGDGNLTATKGSLIFKASVHSPLIKIVSVTLRPDGSNIVDVTAKIYDADGDNTQVRMMYLDPDTGEYSNCYLAGPVSVTYTDTAGVPDIDNSEMYQLGVTAGYKIITAPGTNSVSFSWLSTNNIPDPSGTYTIKLIANDHQIDSGSAFENIDIGNVEPILNIVSAAQRPDGSEQVDVKFKIWDADGSKCRAKILWSASSNGPFVAATLMSNSAVAKYNDSGGPPSVDINSNYQIGSSINYQIVTLPTTNEVDFIWDAKKDLPGASGLYWIRIVGNDSQLDAAAATITLKLGNHLPQANILSARHDDDNFGYIKVKISLNDIDKDELRLKVEWSKDNSLYTKCEIVNNVKDRYGDSVFVDNSKDYQIGDKTGEGISTASGANEIIFYWNKNKDIGNKEGNYWLKVTVNDSTVDGIPVIREIQIISVPVDDAIVSDNLLESDEEKSVFQFNLSKEMSVYMGIYDIRGYEVKKIAERSYAAGIHKVEWDGRTEKGKRVSNGRYWLVIKTEKWKKIIPIAVLR